MTEKYENDGAEEELTVELLRIVFDAAVLACAHLKKIIDLFFGADTVRIVDITLMAGDRDDLCTKLGRFLADAPGHVAVAGRNDRLPCQRIALIL